MNGAFCVSVHHLNLSSLRLWNLIMIRKKKRKSPDKRPKIVCGRCSLLINPSEVDEHFRIRHGVNPKKMLLNRPKDKYSIQSSDEQPRFEGGFKYLQGGSPGLNKRKR
jgi:hypothetical protein